MCALGCRRASPAGEEPAAGARPVNRARPRVGPSPGPGCTGLLSPALRRAERLGPRAARSGDTTLACRSPPPP